MAELNSSSSHIFTELLCKKLLLSMLSLSWCPHWWPLLVTIIAADIAHNPPFLCWFCTGVYSSGYKLSPLKKTLQPACLQALPANATNIWDKWSNMSNIWKQKSLFQILHCCPGYQVVNNIYSIYGAVHQKPLSFIQ